MLQVQLGYINSIILFKSKFTVDWNLIRYNSNGYGSISKNCGNFIPFYNGSKRFGSATATNRRCVLHTATMEHIKNFKKMIFIPVVVRNAFFSNNIFTDCISREQFLTLLNHHKENLTEEIKEDVNERMDEM